MKYPERVKDSTKTAISVMFCGNAAGQVLPCYVVYKAENLWSTWTEGGPKRTRYNRSSSGSTVVGLMLLVPLIGLKLYFCHLLKSTVVRR